MSIGVDAPFSASWVSAEWRSWWSVHGQPCSPRGGLLEDQLIGGHTPG